MTISLHQEVEQLTDALLTAAEQANSAAYAKHYAALLALCYEYAEEKQNHPLQWEILADFTEDSQEAISFYQKALGFADEIRDFSALYSSQISLARLYKEINNDDETRMAADAALDYATLSKDSSLIDEAETFIQQLT